MPDEPTPPLPRPYRSATRDDAPQHAGAPHAGAPHAGAPDEVSLRDLYLVFRRGLPVILGLALLAAAAAYLWVALRPPVFEAEATVTTGTPAVRMRDDTNLVFAPDGDGAPLALDLEPPRPLSFDAYRTVAESRTVFHRALELLAAEGLSGARGGASVDDVPAPDIADLETASSLEDVGGATNPLIVEHAVRWVDPVLAAQYSNAWALATVEQVQEILLADLDAVLAVTQATTSERLARVEALEASLAALPEDAPAQERARLDRELALARRAHASVAGLAPLASYIADLVPSATRVLDAAAPPTEPTGQSPVLVAAVALILGGLLGTVLVFLQAAVRDPSGASSSATEGDREHDAQSPEARV